MKSNCQFYSNYINYFEILYCSELKNVPVITYILFLLWLLFLFVMLCIISSKYFVPVLTDLSLRLNIGHEISGLTLLALGNGASDFASNIAASNAGALGLVSGEVLGSGLLVTTISVSVILLGANKTIELDELTFVKDILVYIASLTAVFFMFWYGKIYVYMAVLITVFYIGYVVLSIYLNKRYKKEKRSPEDQKNKDSKPTIASLTEDEIKPMYEEPFSLDYFRNKYNKMSKLKKAFFILTFIPCLPLNLTINTVRWNRAIAAISPITCWIPIFGVFKIVDKTIPSGFPVIVIMFLIGAVCCFIILFTTNDLYPPSYSILFSILSFIVCLCWSYIVVNEIIGLLKTFGYILNISEILLGVTILTVGNGLPDVISSYLLSRKGFGRLAMSAAYAGPIFNILFSIGVAFIIKTARDFPSPLTMDTNNIFFITSGFLMFNLYISLLSFGLFMKFKLRKYYSFWLIFLYVSYIIVIILAETNVIWKQ